MVLLMTVGLGDANRLEETLLAPMRKSIATNPRDMVVLLPSQWTEANARLLASDANVPPLEVRALPEPGQENDMDACFGHFDRIIGDYIARGVPTHRMVADFTRGTKAMSAALVLAAVNRGIPTVRYIYGTP